MEKTLLESELEKTLLELEMPLEERAYAEDLDFEAEIEDLLTEVKSTDSIRKKIIYSILGGELSDAQIQRGHQHLLKRTSQIYKGLGFIYVISTFRKLVAGLSTKNIADKIISKRDFGRFGAEVLDVWYNQDAAWQLREEKSRYQSQLVNKFYDDINN